MSPDALTRARRAYAERAFPLVLTLLQPLIDRPDAAEPVLAMAANAALLSGRYSQAVELLLRLRTLQPGNPAYARIAAQAYNRIGVEARRQRQAQAAEKALLAALAQWPDHPEALFNLASLLGDRGQPGQALPYWERLHALRPEDQEVLRDLAICLGQSGRSDAAAQRLANVPFPTEVLPALHHARALAWAGTTAAIPGLLKRLSLQPEHAQGLFDLAGELEQASNIDTAQAVLDCLIGLLDQGRMAPGMRALFNRHLMLAPVSSDRQTHAHQLESYARGLERLRERFTQLADDPGCERRLSQLASDNFLLPYQHSDGRLDRRLQSCLGALLGDLAPRFAWPGYRPAAPRSAGGGRRRSRIGLLSSHWRVCTVGSYFSSWIAMLADAGHEVRVFQVGPHVDNLTRSLARRSKLQVLGGSLEEMGQQVADTRCDLLIYPELGLDRRLLPLAALRLAPRQACAWGHPVTSGLPSVDAYISCAEMEPPGAADFYTETLLLLPGLGTDYLRPELPKPASRQALGLAEDSRLYLVPHAPYKLHVDSDEVWSGIAALDPEAVLVLFAGASPALAGPLLERLRQVLARAGADPERQVLMLPQVSRSRFLQIAQACDVMVDTLHWSGGNSTLDSLLCGLPVLTCEGRVMRARQSAAMLRRIGLPELIVEDPDDLAPAAVALAQDRQRRQALSRHIIGQLPALFDASGVAQALAGHVDRLLHDWPDSPAADGAAAGSARQPAPEPAARTAPGPGRQEQARPPQR